jgi:hypothetical protein
VNHPWRAMGVWWSMPYILALTGIVLAVAIIQFIMRQVFIFGNLLLAPNYRSLHGPDHCCLLLRRG